MEKDSDHQFYSDDTLDNEISVEELQQNGAKLSDTWLYQLMIKAAYRILNKPLVIFRLLKKVVARLQSYESLPAFAQDLKDKVELLVRMLKAYTSKEYTKISTKNAALSIAALLYFVAPLDFIPDILAIGLLDDLAVLAWVYHNFNAEIEAFLDWEDAHKKVRIDISDYSETSE